MPALVKKLSVIIVSKGVITEESAVTCTDVLVEMSLPNCDETAPHSIAAGHRNSPGVHQGVSQLGAGLPQMLVVSPGCCGRRCRSSLALSHFQCLSQENQAQRLQRCSSTPATHSPSSSLSTGDVTLSLGRTMGFVALE